MNDFTPLYVQMARDLRADIVNGVYRMGDAIPSELTLVKKYGTTRGTVRSAIATLVNDGLVRQVRGKGTFVQLRTADYSIRNFGGFTDSLNNSGEAAVSHVVEQVVESEGSQKFLRLVRVRGISDGQQTRFLSVDTSWIPLDLFPGLSDRDFENASLYRVFREVYGIHPRRTEVVLAPEQPAPRTVELLAEPKGTTLLAARGSVFDDDNVEIERIHIVYASTVQFNLTTAIQEVPALAQSPI